MTDDLSDQTQPPDPYRAVLLGGLLTAVGVVPVVGGAIATAMDSTFAYKQARLIAEGFDKAAGRIRALEDRPTPEQMLESDEFTAACQVAMEATLRAASAAKRKRLAEALARMGPWGPYDEDERADLFALVERYTDLHIALLQMFEDPASWIEAQEPVAEYRVGTIKSVLDRYMFPGGIGWQLRAERVIAELERDGLIAFDGGPVGAIGLSVQVLSKSSTRLGDRFLRFVAEP